MQLTLKRYTEKDSMFFNNNPLGFGPIGICIHWLRRHFNVPKEARKVHLKQVSKPTRHSHTLLAAKRKSFGQLRYQLNTPKWESSIANDRMTRFLQEITVSGPIHFELYYWE